MARLRTACGGLPRSDVSAKIGMKNVNADCTTAIRSIVQAAFVAGFALVIGAWAKATDLRGRPLAIAMIVASGITGGLSWIFAFRDSTG